MTVKRHALTAFLGAAIAATAVVSATPAGAATAPAKPTVVLVHGAFADASSWNGVVQRLRRDGYKVIAPANPLRRLADDSAYISALLKTVKGPVVLAGHSYGAQVATNAARGNANVKALVSVAGFLPDEGESAAALSGKFPGSTLGETLTQVPLPGGQTDLYVAQDKFRKQFAHDVPAREAALMAATQRPVTEAALNDPSGVPAWKTVPAYVLIPTGDKNIPPAAQHFMADRAHARATVEVKKASHAVLVSEPGVVADLIERAARDTTR